MDPASAERLLDLAEEAGPELRGLEREATFARLEERHAELVDALEHFVRERRTDEAIRLARALGPFWQATKRLEAGTDWFGRVLALPDGDDDLRARASFDAGLLWFWRGDDGRAGELFDQALELGRSVPTPTAAALALTGHARIALRLGDLDEARRLCLEAVEVSGDDRLGRAGACHVLGVTAQIAGDLVEARRWMTERIELAREDGNDAALAMEANNLAMVERQLGDFARAEALSREALDTFHRRRDEWAIPFGLSGLAAVAVERGELERAATLVGAAEALMEAQGSAWPPDERPHFERTLAAVEAAGASSARRAGRRLSPDEAVAYALGRAR